MLARGCHVDRVPAAMTDEVYTVELVILYVEMETDSLRRVASASDDP